MNFLKIAEVARARMYPDRREFAHLSSDVQDEWAKMARIMRDVIVESEMARVMIDHHRVISPKPMDIKGFLDARGVPVGVLMGKAATTPR
jgi:hypothetical protein